MTAFSIFLSIAGVGFLFLLISLIFGEIFDHFDFSVDHDFDHSLEQGGPGILSSRVLSVFVTAFGGFGAMATHYGLGPVPASGVGFGSGVVFGSVVYVFARFLWGQQATSETLNDDLAGQPARVVIAIPEGGVGQVRCRLGEQLIDKIARSRDGRAIPEHTPVQIEEVLGETVIVARADARAANQGDTKTS